MAKVFSPTKNNNQAKRIKPQPIKLKRRTPTRFTYLPTKEAVNAPATPQSPSILQLQNPTFFAFAKGMLKDAGAAEDIIQNVFMKIWIHREALDETMSIKNYIYVLSKREVFNYLRAKYNTHVVLTEDMMTLERPSSIDEPTTDYRELREAVQSVINTMPPKRRSVFCLSRFKSLTNQEIADKLGISIRTVEKHIELALRTFKEQLGSFFALFVGWFL